MLQFKTTHPNDRAAEAFDYLSAPFRKGGEGGGASQGGGEMAEVRQQLQQLAQQVQQLTQAIGGPSFGNEQRGNDAMPHFTGGNSRGRKQARAKWRKQQRRKQRKQAQAQDDSGPNFTRLTNSKTGEAFRLGGFKPGKPHRARKGKKKRTTPPGMFPGQFNPNGQTPAEIARAKRQPVQPAADEPTLDPVTPPPTAPGVERPARTATTDAGAPPAPVDKLSTPEQTAPDPPESPEPAQPRSEAQSSTTPPAVPNKTMEYVEGRDRIEPVTTEQRTDRATGEDVSPSRPKTDGPANVQLDQRREDGKRKLEEHRADLRNDLTPDTLKAIQGADVFSEDERKKIESNARDGMKKGRTNEQIRSDLNRAVEDRRKQQPQPGQNAQQQPGQQQQGQGQPQQAKGEPLTIAELERWFATRGVAMLREGLKTQ